MAQTPYRLDWLHSPDEYQDELDRQEAARYASLGQFGQIREDAARAAQGTAEGIQQIGHGLLNLGPTQQQSRALAGQELRELAARVQPGTPEWYDAASKILSNRGLTAQAEQMALRGRSMELGQAEKSEVLRLQQTLDLLNKRLAAGDESVRPAIDAVVRKLQQLGTFRPGAERSGEYERLAELYREAVRSGDMETAAIYKARLDALAKQGGTGGLTPYQQEQVERNKRLDAEKKEEREKKRADAENATKRALLATVRGLDDSLGSAVRLLNHPGLNTIVGFVAGGRSDELVGSLGPDAAGAMALYRQVQGQTFLSALGDLKAQSRTGASGLGQLTEIEGAKIQNAKAALHRQQSPEQFKRTLQGYIAQLQATRAAAAQELGGSAPPAPAIVSDSPADRIIDDVRGRTQPRRRSGDTVTIEGPDGRRWQIPADRLPDAERRGARRVN
jgi:hypothetical protein